MALSPTTVGRALRLLVVGVAAYYAVWGGEYSAFDLARLRRQQVAEADSLSALRRQVDSLRVAAERLETDPATLERVARERFGMIRDGEVLYRFVSVRAPDPAAPAAP